MTFSQQQLREMLAYDRETGEFTWLASRCHAPSGKPAGKGRHHSGYRCITVCGRKYAAHRLAWFYEHGRWPGDLDHMVYLSAKQRFHPTAHIVGGGS